MKKEVEIRLPEELKDFVIINTVLTPDLKGFAILIMGQDLEPTPGHLPTIRIYLLKEDDSAYYIEEEIEAFSFLDNKSAMDFVRKLPKMSALEILLIMHGQNRQVESEFILQ